MDKHLKIASGLVKLLENRFNIFGVHIGLDPILGLIPGFGDMISALLSFYLVWIALVNKIPEDKVAQMVQNIFVDFLIGIIPVVGDIGDIFYRANTKNLAILKQYMVTDAEIVTS